MGTGLISSLLKNEGNQVYVTSRQQKTDTDRVHYIRGNAKDLSFIKSLLTYDNTWDAIVDFMIYTEHEFSERIEMLLSSTTQYVFLSSARVYADSKKAITEDSDRLLDVVHDKDFLNSGNYAIVKAKQENILFEYPEKKWTIIRPYITYSNSKLQLGVQEKEEWLYRVLHNRSIVFSEDLKDKKTTVTFGDDVSRAIAALIGCPQALGEIYNISSFTSATWGEILDCYVHCLKTAGISVKVHYVDTVSKITDNKYKYLYDRLLNRTFSTKKLQDTAASVSFVPYNEGLLACLNQFLSTKQFREIDWGRQAMLDRISRERVAWNEIVDLRDKVKYFLIRYLLTESQYEKLHNTFRLHR